MNKKAIILLSGGIDSQTCLAIALSQGYECIALTFDYGQRHRVEIPAAQTMAKKQDLPWLLQTINGEHFKGSALTDAAISVPQHQKHQLTAVNYVPARNTVFFSFALAMAEVHQAQSIFFGATLEDAANFPDTRPAYFRAFEAMANLATKKADIAQDDFFKIETPLINYTKADVIRCGLELGVDYGLSITCYQANAQGQACGQCDSCVVRRQGFMDAHVADPTRYIHTSI